MNVSKWKQESGCKAKNQKRGQELLEGYFDIYMLPAYQSNNKETKQDK